MGFRTTRGPSASERASILSTYWSTAETNAHWHWQTRYPTMSDPNVYINFCTEWYDGPYVFWLLSTRSEISAPVQSECLALALAGILAFAPYTAGPPERSISGGYRQYNEGAWALSTDSRVSAGDQQICQDVARRMAMFGSYSNPSIIKKSHEYWVDNNFRGVNYGQTFGHPGREFARGVDSMLTIRPLMTPNALIDTYLHDVVDDLILGNTTGAGHWPLWTDMCDNWTHAEIYAVSNQLQTGEKPYLWLPFMHAHSAKALIKYYDDPFDDTLNTQIENTITHLARNQWPRIYRVGTDDPYNQALYYRPFAVEGTESVTNPNLADLSMFQMPMYAWCWSVTRDDWFYRAAVHLLRNGLQYGYMQGTKQFNQSYLWSLQGLRYLGWVA